MNATPAVSLAYLGLAIVGLGMLAMLWAPTVGRRAQAEVVASAGAALLIAAIGREYLVVEARLIALVVLAVAGLRFWASHAREEG